MAQSSNRVIGLIVGSGLAKGLEALLDRPTVHEAHDVHWSDGVPGGLVLGYTTGFFGKTPVVILPRHGPTLENPDRSPQELVEMKGYEANVWALYKLGVTHVFGFSAVGAIDESIPLASEGAFVIPHTYGRGIASSRHSFGSASLDVHTNMKEPFSNELRAIAADAVRLAGGYPLTFGCYIYNGGDTFETGAEIMALGEMYQGQQNRVVGMTTVPESILLKQMRIPFAAICSNVNYAEGITVDTLVSHETTLDVMGKAGPYLLNIAENILKKNQ